MPPRKGSKKAKAKTAKPKVIYEEESFVCVKDRDSKEGFYLAQAAHDIVEDPESEPMVRRLELHDQKSQIYTISQKENEVILEDILSSAKLSEVSKKIGRKVVNGFQIDSAEYKRFQDMAGIGKSKHDETGSSDEESEESEGTHDKSSKVNEESKTRIKKKVVGPKKKGTEILEESSKDDSQSDIKKRTRPSKGAPTPLKSAEKVVTTRSAKKTKQTDTKGKKAKDDEEDYDESQSEEEETKVSSQKGKSSKKQSEKYKKGKFNPNVEILGMPEQLTGKSKNPSFTANVRNNNKEVLRAVFTQNLPLLKAIISSSNSISTVCQPWAPEWNMHPVVEAFKAGNIDIINALIEQIQKTDKKYTSINQCSLKEVDTGFNDFYAYGVRTRKVAMSRGGKEGNNAFVADLRSHVDSLEEVIPLLYLQNVKPELIDHLRALAPSVEYSLENYIFEAVRAGNCKLAGHLIHTANKRGGYGFNQIHEFALTKTTGGQLGEFKKPSATKKAIGNKCLTPIHCACINLNVGVLKALLEKSFEYNVTDEELRKPVHYAAACESPGPLEYLLEKGVDSREGDRVKISPLMLACRYGRDKNVEVLLQGDRSVLLAKSKEGMSAIHYASKYGHTKCVELLVKKGTDINMVGPNRQCPIHLAASYGHSDLVEYLIQNGASVLKRDKCKRSPLICAVKNGDLKTASILLRNGAPFDFPDSSNNYPLHYACAYGFNEIIDLLLKAGADPNPNNSWNLSPLLVAMLKANYDTVKKMLTYPNTNVNCKDDSGRTLVSNSINNISEFGLEQLTYLVEEKFADVNIPDIKGMAPLHYLCSLKAKTIAQKNVLNWSKLNEKEQRDYLNHYQDLILKFAQVLLKNNANLNVSSLDGSTPFGLVLAHKNTALIDLFTSQPSLVLDYITKINTCIYHDMGNLIMKRSLKSTFELIYAQLQNKNNLLNHVDDKGYTPILNWIKSYSKVANEKYSKLLEKFKSKKMEEKIISVGGTLESPAKKPGKSPFRGGARTFQTARKSIPAKAPRLKVVSAHEGKNVVVDLTDEEINLCKDQASKAFEELVVDFLHVLKLAANGGGHFGIPVDKLKEHRDAPDPLDLKMRIENKKSDLNEDEEELEFDDDNSDDDQIAFNNKSTNKKIVPYGDEGLQTCIHLLMKSPHLKILEYLISLSVVDLNAKDYKGNTALMIFVQNNSDERRLLSSLENLLKNGADPKIPNEDLEYPILHCVKRKLRHQIDYLCNYGANLNVSNKKGQTPLIICVNSNDLALTETLVNKGADPNYAGHANRTSLHWAVHKASQTTDSSFEMISLLVSKGGDVNKIDERGRSPLHYAFVKIGDPFSTGHIDPIEIVSSLCGISGIKVDTCDKWGNTPLSYAAQTGANVSAIYLLKRGANIEHTNEDKNTPLAISILSGHSNMATSLIQNNANVSKKCVKIDPAIKIEKEKEAEKGGEDLEEPQAKPVAGFGYPRPFAFKTAAFGGFGVGKGGYSKAPAKKARRFGDLYQGDDDEEVEDGTIKDGEYSMFRYALKQGWQGVAYLILESGYNIMLAIQDAMSEKKMQYVYTLLLKRDNKKEYQTVNEEGQNLWHTFARDCSKIVSAELYDKICRQFDRLEIPVNVLDKHKRSPMHYAAQSSFNQLIEKLMSDGLNLNAIDINNDTPLSLYLKGTKATPNLKALENFKKNGADFSVKFSYKWDNHGVVQVTPLIYIILQRCKDITIMNYLLENGSSVNEQDLLGFTPIIHAVRQNSKKLVKFFLAKPGVQLNLVDSEGRTPIHHCVNPMVYGSYENTEMLAILAKYYDVNKPDKHGKSPLFYASLQDSGTLASKLKELGATEVKLGGLKRAGTSIISTVEFSETTNFEEDAEMFIEHLKEKENKNKICTEEKEMPDRNVSGHVEVVYDTELGPYSLLMTKIDISHGQWSGNVFYKMQLLHEKNRDVYVVFTRWGRVGDIGQFQQTPFSKKDEAILEFSKIFKEKSGNEWKNKEKFVKVPKKYHLLKFEKKPNVKNYLESFDLKNPELPKTSLMKSTYQVIHAITDVKMYSTTFKNFGIDEEILPLSHLTKESLSEAKGLLDEIGDLIEELEKKRKNLTMEESRAAAVLQISEEISEKSSRFYELVPHTQFRTQAVPPISSKYMLGQKKEMINNLLDYEVTTKIILGAYYNIKKIHPLDYCFKSLHLKMLPLQNEDAEYQIILHYIQNGWQGYNEKVIKNIFAIERPGEADRIKEWKHLKNRMLLWHGTKLQNVMSILYSGMKIAPPEAPVTGYMFGKGVYFADTFEKSYNYCMGHFGYYQHGTTIPNMKVMFLCEVALGNMLELKQAEFITHLKAPYNSVKGVGKKGPNFKKNIVLANGAIVPIGEQMDYPDKEANTGFGSWNCLQHNEYIVYNVNQVRIRYIVQMADNDDIDF